MRSPFAPRISTKRRRKFLVHVDDDFLDWLKPLPRRRIEIKHATRGRDTVSSKPSRRMVSIRTAELEFAASGNLIRSRCPGPLDAKRDVRLDSRNEPLANAAT